MKGETVQFLSFYLDSCGLNPVKFQHFHSCAFAKSALILCDFDIDTDYLQSEVRLCFFLSLSVFQCFSSFLHSIPPFLLMFPSPSLSLSARPSPLPSCRLQQSATVITDCYSSWVADSSSLAMGRGFLFFFSFLHSFMGLSWPNELTRTGL